MLLALVEKGSLFVPEELTSTKKLLRAVAVLLAISARIATRSLMMGVKSPPIMGLRAGVFFREARGCFWTLYAFSLAFCPSS
jgi:hypothetical protein